MQIKDYLGTENARNKKYAALYCEMIKKAFGEGAQCDVLIGHHLTFELDKDLNSENEIPSADCLMFDHDIMGKIFGDQALSIMSHLAGVPVQSRDEVLAAYFECVGVNASPTFPPGATIAEWRAALGMAQS